MASLITLQEAKWQLNYEADDKDALIDQLSSDASDIVIDYIKRPSHGWTTGAVPGPIRMAIKIVLTNLFAHRGDDVSDPLSQAVRDILIRFRDPAFAAITVAISEDVPSSVTLSALVLTATTYPVGSSTDTAIGTIVGITAGSTLSIVDDDDRVQISGNVLQVGPTGDDVTAGTFSITIRETFAGASNSPRDTAFTITASVVIPALSVLSLLASTYPKFSPTGTLIGDILGKTAGSTLSIFPANSRVQISGTQVQVGPTGDDELAGTFSFTIRETLSGSSNSPRDTLLTVTVQEALAALTLSDYTFTEGDATGTVIGNIIGKTAGSTLSLFPADDRVQISGTQLQIGPTGDELLPGPFNVTIRETLAGASNTPRDTILAMTVDPGIATYLPVVDSSPEGAFGLNKMVAGYSGAALRLIRASDSSQIDIGFVGSAQAFDTNAAIAFQGSSTVSIVTLYDQSGNGNHMTQSTPSRPILWLGAGGPVMLVGNAGNFPIPPALSVDRANTTILQVQRTAVQSGGFGFWDFGDLSTYQLGLRSYSNAFSMQPLVGTSTLTPSNANVQTVNIGNMSIIGAVSGASGLVIHRDDQTVAYPAQSSVTMSSGGLAFNTHTVGNRGDAVCFVVYPTALDTDDMTAVKAALKTIYGTVDPAATAITMQGDSITFGTGSANNRNISAEAVEYLSKDALVRNIGVAGSQIGSGGTFDTQPGRFCVPGVRNVLRVHLGTNDLVNGTPLADVIAGLRHNCAAARQTGAYTHIIGVPALTRPLSPSMLADQRALREWFRSDPLDTNGVRCFDAIDDLCGDAIIGDAATDAGGGMDDTSISSDKIHPNQSMITSRLAPAFIAALQSLDLSPNPIAVAVTVSTPVNTSAPVVTGSSAVGVVLTCSAGQWRNNTSSTTFTELPNRYRYQWRRGSTDISGATQSTYTTQAADAGNTVTCRLTCSNSAASVSVTSNGIAVSNSLSIGGTPITSALEDSAYSGFTVSAFGGTAPYTFSVASGSLPPGITLNASTGAVSGTPTTAGTYSAIVIRVTDAAAATADLASFTITVAATSTLLLDTLSAVPSAAYSMRKVRSAYAGAALSVTRSTDNVTQDINFDGSGNLDTASMLSFLGAATGTINTWYDQTGNGRHMVQATVGSQPTLVNAGALLTKNSLPSATFSTRNLACATLTGSPSIRTVSFVAAHNNNTNFDVIKSSANGGYQIRIAGSNHLVTLLKLGAAAIGTAASGPVAGALFTGKTSYDGAAYDIAVNGSSVASGASSVTFTSGLSSIIGSSSSANTSISEMLIFDTALLSGADQTAVQASQKTYFGTP